MSRADLSIRRWLLPALAGGGFVALAAWFAGFGEPLFPAAPLAALETFAIAAPTAGAWLLGAFGLGRLARPLLHAGDPARPDRGGAGAASIQLASGIAIALFVAHLMGVLGLLRPGPGGAWLAWLPIFAGLLLVGLQVRAAAPDLGRWSPLPAAGLLALPAAALLAVAASQPPGALWASEAHAFDARSYHLQLPKEWLAGGRIEPLAHNVYSYLPSYVEAAGTQLAAMMNTPAARAGGGGGPASGRGWPLFAAQFLHAALAVITALFIARLVRLAGDAHAAARSYPHAQGKGRGEGRTPAALAGAIFLSIPWITVAASLAYNEMAVTALLAGAMLVVIHPALGPASRGALAGFLMGAACSCKPTALVTAAAPVGVALLAATPPRQWARLVLPGLVAGAIACAPWLIRNWSSCGNPVFPFLTGLLGRGHWTLEQVGRFHEAHHSDASPAQRLALLFSRRGVLHDQWSIFPALVAAALPVALASRATRRAAATAALVLALQLVAWLAVGHLQSRFLIPLAVPGAVLIGLAAAAALPRAPLPMGEGRGVDSAPSVPRSSTSLSTSSTDRRSARLARTATVITATAALALSAETALNYFRQNDGRPNALLIGGVPLLNGEALRRELPRLPPAEQQHLIAAGPVEAYLNVVLPTVSPVPPRVYLLGDSTPLYLETPVLWNTTWDEWPLLRAVDESGGDMAAAASRLRARGVTHVLVNLAEIDRLRKSGYSDPRLTTDFAVRFMQDGGGALVAAWTDGGQSRYLVDLTGVAPASP